jgi:hypothetical protein
MEKVKPGLTPDAYAASSDDWRGEELRRLRTAALAVDGVEEAIKWVTSSIRRTAPSP